MKRTAELGMGAMVLLLSVSAATAARIYPSAGSTSAAFLKIGVGARAVAMGGAFSAVPGDPYSIYWNPAGLADLDGEKRAGLFHNEYFQGLGQEFVFYTAPASGLSLPLAGRPRGGVFGLGLNYFYVPKEMERRSGLNEADPLNPISPVEGKFGAYDVALSAAYGWESSPGFRLGAALKAIRQSVDDESGSSAALDLGLQRDFRWRGAAYTAGFAVWNLGPGIKFVERRYGLPLSFRAGLSRRLEQGALVALEADKPVDNYPSATLGVEYPLTERLALRSGYRYRLYGNELGAWSGFSAGAGVAFDKVSFDYAFTPFGGLGDSHRFSVVFRFGEAGRPATTGAAAPALLSATALPFETSARTLAISREGAKYEIRASAPAGALYELSFRTLARAEAPAVIEASEGSLPAELAAKLPAGTRPLKAWGLSRLPGRLQGEVRLSFRLDSGSAQAGRVRLLYFEDGVWKDAGAAPAGEDGSGRNLFTALVPQAAYYAAVESGIQ
jgi:hypothetical protein